MNRAFEKKRMRDKKWHDIIDTFDTFYHFDSRVTEASVEKVENRRIGGEKLYTCKESAKNVKTVTTKIYIKETNSVPLKINELY